MAAVSLLPFTVPTARRCRSSTTPALARIPRWTARARAPLTAVRTCASFRGWVEMDEDDETEEEEEEPSIPPPPASVPLPRYRKMDVSRDYYVDKVSAKEVEKMVRGERTKPLIVDFYATWCGPCIQMAQELEMLILEYEGDATFVKVDTDDEYEFALNMQVRGLPTLYFFSPDPDRPAIRVEGLVSAEMIRDIIDNEL